MSPLEGGAMTADDPIEDQITDDEEPDDEDDDVDGDADDETGVPPPAEESDEASLEELLARKAARKEDGADEAEDDTVLTLEPEERLGTSLPGKVTPKQATEFVCKSCFLVKHQSQLADKKRTLCRDCA
jgi:hypothetical protein